MWDTTLTPLVRIINIAQLLTWCEMTKFHYILSHLPQSKWIKSKQMPDSDPAIRLPATQSFVYKLSKQCKHVHLSSLTQSWCPLLLWKIRHLLQCHDVVARFLGSWLYPQVEPLVYSPRYCPSSDGHCPHTPQIPFSRISSKSLVHVDSPISSVSESLLCGHVLCKQWESSQSQAKNIS